MAVLDIIDDERLQNNARVVGQHLLHGLSALMDKHAVIGDVRRAVVVLLLLPWPVNSLSSHRCEASDCLLVLSLCSAA